MPAEEACITSLPARPPASLSAVHVKHTPRTPAPLPSRPRRDLEGFQTEELGRGGGGGGGGVSTVAVEGACVEGSPPACGGFPRRVQGECRALHADLHKMEDL